MIYRVMVVKEMYFMVEARTKEEAEQFVLEKEGADWELYEQDTSISTHALEMPQKDPLPRWAD